MASPIDRYPRIVFGRSNIALTAMVSGQCNQPVTEVRIERAITGINTVVESLRQSVINLDEFEYCEIVAVSPVMASAPPIEVKEVPDDEDELSSDMEDEQALDDDSDDSGDDYDYWGGLILKIALAPK